MTSVNSSESPRGARVSVCLLVYNDVASLADTVHSVLAQTLPDFEFIISDDGSKDGTWEALLELAKSHPNIRAIQTPRNMKMCGNTNFAVSHASGEYVALLHHGDIYRQDLLERWLKVMERYQDVGFVFNEYASQLSDGVRLQHKIEGCNFPELIPGRQLLEQWLLRMWGCPVWGTTMFRRSSWEAVGGMREEFGMLADIDLWMRMAARWDVGYVNEPLITLQKRTDRPDYYPSDYTMRFFWGRMKLLYSIHAANLAQHYAKSGLRSWWKWLLFRYRVSVETSWWLTYAVVRKKRDMIRESVDAKCPWEWLPVRWYRNCLIWGSRLGIL